MASYFTSSVVFSRAGGCTRRMYQLLLHKKVYFYNIVATHFTENLEQIRTHFPYFYFAFSVFWSSPVEQLIKS